MAETAYWGVGIIACYEVCRNKERPDSSGPLVKK
ncbi:hypothetical protein DET1406 [Dehalococcoides mccartyi 195]|uniref:Uncharacterized protein n=1 Tax=Dehalococcoides mccartyi (strain ATCC BAA-2266 / KCTC 15142 / 195) TaxID=243164 RepID=Q3Z6N4_DEHM1|nr:hypothetical protein DET1406 [Dehalococcoides mccartyi 195]